MYVCIVVLSKIQLVLFRYNLMRSKLVGGKSRRRIGGVVEEGRLAVGKGGDSVRVQVRTDGGYTFHFSFERLQKRVVVKDAAPQQSLVQVQHVEDERVRMRQLVRDENRGLPSFSWPFSRSKWPSHVGNVSCM